MQNVIHKIFSGKTDEEVHSDFLKFSRGSFANRYLLEGKKQKGRWSLKSSSEFANFFVSRMLEAAPDKIQVKGAIISTFDMRKDITFPIADTKGYMGIKQLIIDNEIEKKVLIELMKKYPRAFYALSFSFSENELKIKAKAPKSGKPGNKTKGDEEGPKADFCSLKTSRGEIANDLFFDFPHFNEIKINHVIEVREIEIPKNAKTPEEMRERSIRKGVVKRMIDIDGRKEMKEAKFAA